MEKVKAPPVFCAAAGARVCVCVCERACLFLWLCVRVIIPAGGRAILIGAIEEVKAPPLFCGAAGAGVAAERAGALLAPGRGKSKRAKNYTTAYQPRKKKARKKPNNRIGNAI